MTPNPHKVPVKQWRKWSDETRSMFNELFPSYAEGFMNALLPPSMYQSVSPKQARVLAWNAAWIAADEMEKARNQFLLGHQL